MAMGRVRHGSGVESGVVDFHRLSGAKLAGSHMLEGPRIVRLDRQLLNGKDSRVFELVGRRRWRGLGSGCEGLAEQGEHGKREHQIAASGHAKKGTSELRAKRLGA